MSFLTQIISSARINLLPTVHHFSMTQIRNVIFLCLLPFVYCTKISVPEKTVKYTSFEVNLDLKSHPKHLSEYENHLSG